MDKEERRLLNRREWGLGQKTIGKCLAGVARAWDGHEQRAPTGAALRLETQGPAPKPGHPPSAQPRPCQPALTVESESSMTRRACLCWRSLRAM